MKKITTIVLLVLIVPSLIFAQGIKNKGAKIVVKENAEMVISGNNGNFTNQTAGSTDGEMYLDGTLTVRGSFYNNSGGAVFAGTDTLGLVVMENENSAIHQLGGTGTTSFENLGCPASNTVKIPAGTVVRVKYNFTLDGTLDIYGDLYIEQVFINNGSITGTGTVHYESAEPQVVAPGYYPNLVLDNPGGLVLQDSVFVENELVLTQGSLVLGEHNLVLGPDCVITESKAPGTWVDATGTGYVIKMYDKAGTFEFPVGNFGVNPVYSPVTVDLKEATFDNGQISVRLKPEVHPNNNTGTGFSNYLNRYWEVESDGLSDVVYDIRFDYDESDVTGNEDSIDGAKYKDDEATHWLHYGHVNTTSHFFEATDLSTFSTFTGVQAFRAPTLAITSPADQLTVYQDEVEISGTAADLDSDLENVYVKLNNGSWQLATGSSSWSKTLALEPGKNTILARAKDATDLHSDTASIKVFLSIQIINIPQGWSAISSYLTPLNPALPLMMNEITSNNNLILMLSEYGVYWPPYNTNTIGNWTVAKGYKLKMNAAQEFTVRGDTLLSRSISLSSGYHILPVLSNTNCPITSVFANPQTDIMFIYDVKTSALYWPQGEIATLTTLEPGKGYISNLRNAATLTYPAYSGLKSATISDFTEPEMNGPWQLTRTADVHFVSIKSDAVNNLENAGFIGAFDSFGTCIGYAGIDGRSGNYLLTLYGNDETTEAKDGGEEGEIISFRSFNSSTNAESALIAQFNANFSNADGLYASNGQSQIISFKASSTGIGEMGIAGNIQIFPNPAKDVVNIILTGNQPTLWAWSGFNASLISAEGKVVKTFTISGSQTQIDVSDLNPGVYILKFENAENVVIKRLVIQ